MLSRPVPIADVESEPFWQGCREGRLMIQKCGEGFQFPPTSYCTNCPGTSPEWVQASGLGRVFSWIVVHIGIPRDIYGGQTPYVTALITLQEGPRICANLVDIDPHHITAGLDVEVFFQPVADGAVTLPFFRPVPR